MLKKFCSTPLFLVRDAFLFYPESVEQQGHDLHVHTLLLEDEIPRILLVFYLVQSIHNGNRKNASLGLQGVR